MPFLDQAFRIAGSFEPLTEIEVSSILAKTASVAERRIRTIQNFVFFDGTAKHPEWLGPETA